jgi:hypothetical protein
MLTAGQGTVLSHEGFAKQPSGTKEKRTAAKKDNPAPEEAEEQNDTAPRESKKQARKKERESEETASREKKSRASKAREKKESSSSERRTASRAREQAESPEPVATGVEVRRAAPVAAAPAEEPRRRSAVGRVTDTMRKLLPF